MKIFSKKQVKWCGIFALAFSTALIPIGTSVVYGSVTRQDSSGTTDWNDSDPSSNQYWYDSHTKTNVARPAANEDVTFDNGSNDSRVNLDSIGGGGGGGIYSRLNSINIGGKWIFESSDPLTLYVGTTTIYNSLTLWTATLDTNVLALTTDSIFSSGALSVNTSYLDVATSRVNLNSATFKADTTIHSTEFFVDRGGIVAESNLELADNAYVNVNLGNINITGNLLIGSSATLESSISSPGSGGNLTVVGSYQDKSDSVIDLSNLATFKNNSTISSTNFKSVGLTANADLTLANNANVNAKNGNVTIGRQFIANNGSSLSGSAITFNADSKFHGTTALIGDVTAIGKVTIGDTVSSNIGELTVTGDWQSGNGQSDVNSIVFVIDNDGNVGKLSISGVASADGKAKDNVELVTDNAYAKSQLAAKVSVASENSDWGNNVHDLITADQSSGNNVFTHASTIDSYKFVLKPVVQNGNKIWKLGAINEAVTPEVSSLFTINIVGFDLPRAQNVSGPWARMKGGSVSDDKSQFDENSFQMLQVGWDKSFNSAIGNGSWYAGVLLEGDWMYGNGTYYRNRDTDNPVKSGFLKSEQRGIGAGLYVSRNFENGWYFDLLGRISLFDSQVNMSSLNPQNTASYNGNWTDQIFAMGLEVGKTFNSKNKRWTFTPYNRLLYNSTPNKEFTLNFEGDSANNLVLYVHNQAVDAWTNQLGARLFWNSQNNNGTSFGSLYVGGEYFQGLSGRFGTLTRSDLESKWQASTLGRSKNDLSYGLATVGITLRPREDIMLHSQADVLFGDVSGWAITLGGRYSY
jgi:outer membrane autotransporter protein